MWRFQPDHPISIRSAAQTRLPALRLPNRYSDDVHHGIASYHEIFQHRYLSIVSSRRKGLTFVLGEIDLPPYPFVRYYFDWGVGSPLFNYIWPVIVFTASTLRAFVMRHIPRNSLTHYYTQHSRKFRKFSHDFRNSLTSNLMIIIK